MSIEILNDFTIIVPDFEQNEKANDVVNLWFQFGLVPPTIKPTLLEWQIKQYQHLII